MASKRLPQASDPLDMPDLGRSTPNASLADLSEIERYKQLMVLIRKGHEQIAPVNELTHREPKEAIAHGELSTENKSGGKFKRHPLIGKDPRFSAFRDPRLRSLPFTNPDALEEYERKLQLKKSLALQNRNRYTHRFSPY